METDWGHRMGLMLNIPGVLQMLQSAKSGIEKMRAINAVTFEFYRTIGVLLFTRYSALQSRKLASLDEDLIMLIRNQFESPTLDSWINLGKICAEKLHAMGDKLTRQYTGISNELVEEELVDSCKKLVDLVSDMSTTSSAEFSQPSYPTVMRSLLTLYRRAEAQIFYGPSLQKVTLSGIDKVLPKIMGRLLQPFDIHVSIPTAITKRKVDILRVFPEEIKSDSIHYKSEYERFLYYCYVCYFPDEDLFMYRTSLIHFDEEDNSLAVFSKLIDGYAHFEHISLKGKITEKKKDFRTFDDIFDLPFDDSLDYDSYQTLTQRFGKIAINNGVVHNLAEPLSIYVRRPTAENELLEKLSHKRIYITTLDGGGGFGKSELARSVVWEIMESTRDELIKSLRFDYAVWMSGKIDYYGESKIERKAQPFRTVEDLIDSILYVTNNPAAIARPLPTKRRLVIEVLNQSNSTLLLLDNLETVSEKEVVWDYLIDLGNIVESDLKVLTTSRIRLGGAELVVRLQEMELMEAEELTLREIQSTNLHESWRSEDRIAEIVETSACIPFLIHHIVNLISRGFDLDEISSRLPEDIDRALDFICGMQWKNLDSNGKKLLVGISYWGRKLTFPQAKMLCNLSDKEFQNAKEQLVLCSFLREQSLAESNLDVLPPIALFATTKLNEHPEFRKEFSDTESLLRTPESIEPIAESIDFTEEIALNQIFQRANLLVKQGSIDLAHHWHLQATERFPKAALAWRSLAEFEYIYLDDPQSGNESFRRATLLDSTDSLVFEDWGYMEFQRGCQSINVIAISKSVRLYNQSLDMAKHEEDRKRLRILISESEMELGRIARGRISSAPREKKLEAQMKKDLHYIRAIDILEVNLYSEPETSDMKLHNATVYNLLARCFFSVKTPWSRNRDLLDNCAIYYIIQGFMLDPRSRQLRFTLKHPVLLSALRRYGKKVTEKSLHKQILEKLLELEDNVQNARRKASLVLRINDELR